jgi:hypothetical protein
LPIALHVLLFDSIHGVESEIDQRPQQTRASRLVQPVRQVSEFDIGIEDAFRHWPAESAVAAEVGAAIKGDEEDIGASRIRRRRPELALENSELASALELMRYQANRYRPIAGDGGEFKIRHHHLAEGGQH